MAHLQHQESRIRQLEQHLATGGGEAGGLSEEDIANHVQEVAGAAFEEVAGRVSSLESAISKVATPEATDIAYFRNKTEEIESGLADLKRLLLKVQSFAMELVTDNIKVNAICPGNFFDGPLWSDPDRGLFVQYLRAGKVPGARTVEDVRRSYEARVPMGRGCAGADVVRAIMSVVEQVYETGQAVPVTGGQEMLR